ncbi:MAG: hypothetical protein N2246_10780, partial [Candidatus Sumerlaeia bacterium]|nr:hypothetical protein [Candidatus Sumerlaeia bacterium]
MSKNKVRMGGVLVFLLSLLIMVCWGKEDEPTIEEVSPEKRVIATYAGKELTRADLEMMMRYRGSGRMFFGEPIETLPSERLKSLGEELGGEELIYEKAQR